MESRETRVCIIDSLKRRNNARSNLSQGLCDGFAELGVPCAKIHDATELRVDPAQIPCETTLVIVPYWIGPKAFEMNLAAIKSARPTVKLALYTGTSPYWDGCQWINYRSDVRTLQPVGLGPECRSNFEAIDYFLVVWPRDGVKPACQRTVGMGLFPELTPGTKSPAPLIVLDFMKSGWDEKQYEASARLLADICKQMPDAKVAVLGTNRIAPVMLPSSQIFTVPQEFNPWQQMIGLYQSAWAFVAMNESFGYPIIENLACGTGVYADPRCEMPSCHKVTNISELAGDLVHMKSLGHDGRSALAERVSNDFRDNMPMLVSWKTTCQRILEAVA